MSVTRRAPDAATPSGALPRGRVRRVMVEEERGGREAGAVYFSSAGAAGAAAAEPLGEVVA